MFLWSMPEQMVEQTIEGTVIWDAIVLIMTSLLCVHNSWNIWYIYIWYFIALELVFNIEHKHKIINTTYSF